MDTDPDLRVTGLKRPAATEQDQQFGSFDINGQGVGHVAGPFHPRVELDLEVAVAVVVDVMGLVAVDLVALWLRRPADAIGQFAAVAVTQQGGQAGLRRGVAVTLPGLTDVGPELSGRLD